MGGVDIPILEKCNFSLGKRFLKRPFLSGKEIFFWVINGKTEFCTIKIEVKI